MKQANTRFVVRDKPALISFVSYFSFRQPICIFGILSFSIIGKANMTMHSDPKWFIQSNKKCSSSHRKYSCQGGTVHDALSANNYHFDQNALWNLTTLSYFFFKMSDWSQLKTKLFLQRYIPLSLFHNGVGSFISCYFIPLCFLWSSGFCVVSTYSSLFVST